MCESIDGQKDYVWWLLLLNGGRAILFLVVTSENDESIWPIDSVEVNQ